MKGLIVLLHLLFFISCGSKPGDKEITQNSNASFRVVDITLEATKDRSPKNSFPNFIKEYQVSAVIIDSKTGVPVPLTQFEIDMGDEGSVVKETSLTGKIYWSEKVLYNLNSEKRRILIERNILSRDNRDKMGTVAFSLYPYAEHLGEDISEFSLVSSDEKLTSVGKIEAQKSIGKKSKLELSAGDIKIDYLRPSVEGSLYRFSLNSSLMAILQKSNGEDVEYKLKGGRYQVIIELNTTEGETFYEKVLDQVENKNGLLSFSYEDHIAYSKKFSDISLNLRVMSVDNHESLDAFYGQIRIGKLSKLDGSHGLVFNKESNSRYSDFRFERSFVEKTLSSTYQGLKFSKIVPIFIMYGAGETATRRTVVYSAKTCVSDFYDNESYAGEEFEIKTSSGKVDLEKADDDGCITWIESVTHTYYQPEIIMEKEVEITHKASGIKRKLKNLINPWTILTLGIEEDADDKELKEAIASREEKSSKLYLGEYYFETLSMTYEMDKFMTLFVRKNVLLDIEFKVLRYSSLTMGVNAKEDLRDGVYLLKVGVQKSYIDIRKTLVSIEQKKDATKVQRSFTKKPLDFIYVVEKLVKVKNGRIQTPVEFSVSDLRLMTVRSSLLIQLETVKQEYLELSPNYTEDELVTDRVEGLLEKHFPGEKDPSLDLLVDHDSGLPMRTFVGPMIMLQLEGGAGVIPTDAIEKCRTSDCNWLERNNENVLKREYDHDKKYYGSLEHLEDKSVNTLLQEKEILDIKYKNQKEVESLLYNYLSLYGMKYVSDLDEPLFSLPKQKGNIICPSANITDCFVENTELNIPKKDFLAQFSGNWRVKGPETIEELFEEENQNTYKHALCVSTLDELKLKLKKPGRHGAVVRNWKNRAYQDFLRICENFDPFTFNKIVRSGGIESFNFKGGKMINFDLGSSYDINYQETFSTEAALAGSAEFKPLNMFGPMGSAVNDILGIGISYGMAGASETAYSRGESSEVTSTTYLSMQRAVFDLSFRKPIYCMEIRMKSSFIAKVMEVLAVQDKFVFDLNDLTKGYMICKHNGSEELANKSFRERYYYFAQHFTEGHMLDDGSILNHAWLLALRGERDYLKFVELLGAKPKTEDRDGANGFFTKMFHKMTSGYLDDPEKLLPAFTKNSLAELPLDQISNAYDNVHPSFPGIYVIRPDKKEYPYD